MPHIYDNRGNRVEYIPDLRPGDLLRAKKDVWSKGDGGDLTWVYDYKAFEAGGAYRVHHLYVWDGHTIGYVADADNTMWFASADTFERVPADSAPNDLNVSTP